MSSKRGDLQRSRPQRYQNKTVFKNDLHDKSDKIKRLNAMSIDEVCQKCKDIIQWKIKYRKYKPLTQPKTCNRCNQKSVKKAYHVLCKECAVASKQCAKCLKTESEDCQIIAAELTGQEKLKIDVEMRQLIKSLPERKRRTFLRFMNGRKNKKRNNDDDEEESVDERPKKTPTREELLEKLEKLKVTDEDFYDFNSEEEDFEDENWESDE